MTHEHSWKEVTNNEMWTTYSCQCGAKFECDHLGCGEPTCPQHHPTKENHIATK